MNFRQFVAEKVQIVFICDSENTEIVILYTNCKVQVFIVLPAGLIIGEMTPSQ